MQENKITRSQLESYVKNRIELINYQLEKQQRLYERGLHKKPIRKARKELSAKTRNNIERIIDLLCGNTKFESVNIRKLLLLNDRYKILIDFYLVADGLKIDQEKRKKAGNKNKNIRFMDFWGNYFFTLPIDTFTELRGGTRNSISRNINLFAFLGFICKRNPYKIEVASILSQEKKRKNKQIAVEIAVKKGEFEIGDRKNDFNFLSIYTIPKLKNENFKIAEDKATRLFQVKFSIRAFTSIFLVKYFGIEEASKVYFHTNLIGFTEYSNFLQNKIKDAVIEQVAEEGYTTKSKVYKQVNIYCIAKEFEIIERYGRPRISRRNTFETEYKRVMGELLQENKYIRLSSTVTKEMQKAFNLKSKEHILYDIRILEERGNQNGQQKKEFRPGTSRTKTEEKEQ